MKQNKRLVGNILWMILFICCTIWVNVDSVKAEYSFPPGKSITTKFKAWESSYQAVIKVQNTKKSTVYTKVIDNVKKGKTYTFKWNGKKDNGKYAAYGEYRTKITINGKSKYTDFYYFGNKDFAGGAGTKSSPYLITNMGQLRKVASYNGKYFKQTKDIDGDGTELKPLFSNDSNAFTGHYDGGDHTIRNVNLKLKNNIMGIFGIIGTKGVVENMKLVNFTANTSSKNDCDCGMICGSNYGKIKRVQVWNSSMSEGENIGIIAGLNYTSGQISYGQAYNCKIKATRRGIDMGGVCGENQGLITNGFSSNVSINYKYGSQGGSHATGIGGVCGYINGSSAQIDRSTTRDLSLKLKESNNMCYVGGIVGDYSSSSVLSNLTNNHNYTKYTDSGTKM